MDYLEILEKLAESEKQASLAKELNTTQATVSRWLDGQIPRGNSIEAIKKLAIDRGIITYGTFLQANPSRLELPITGLKVEGTAQAGSFRDISLIDDDYDAQTIQIAADSRYPKAHQYALKLEGDSMNKRYPNGTYVTVVAWADTGLSLKPGMPLHVERHEGSLVEATVKLYAERGDKKWLEPDSSNPKHRPIEIDGNESTQIIIKGLVTGSWRPDQDW